MVVVEATALTEREARVLRLRADGLAHEEIADLLDTDATTDVASADVREIERDAERTIERARRTLDLAATIRRGPVTFTADPETTVSELAAAVYACGDDAAIDVGYCHADLRAHLRDALEDRIEDDRLDAPATLTLTEDGDVAVETSEDGKSHSTTVADRD